MSFALNLLWFIFGGLWLGLLWSLAGVLCFVSIICIPFGFACFRIARFAFLPFGKDIIPAEMMGEKRILGTGLVTFVWCVLFGWWLAVFAAIVGLYCCITIIGIPWGVAAFNISKASFAPLGKRVVDKDMAKVARERWNKAKLDAAFEKSKKA